MQHDVLPGGGEACRTAEAPGRSLGVDHLRSAVVLGLVLFHTARLFDTEAWHIKDTGRFAAADRLVALFNIVQMPLLFLLAGVAAWHSLSSRPAASFVKERFIRLFLPLVVGILLLVSPQVYVERIAWGQGGRMSPIDFSGNFAAFYPGFFSCCYPAANFSWHHLWFLIYLFAYSLALLPVFLLLRSPGGRYLCERAGAWLAKGFRLLWLGLPILLVEMLLRPVFPSTHALIDDFANHAHYLWLILAGWLFAASPALSGAVARSWRLWLGSAAVLVLATLMARELGLAGAWRRPLRALAEWAALVGLFGWASVRLARPLPFLTGFGQLSFAFYMMHQTVIVLLGFALLGWSEAPLLKFGVIAGLAFLLSLAFARLCLWFPALGLLLGVKARSSGKKRAEWVDGRLRTR